MENYFYMKGEMTEEEMCVKEHITTSVLTMM